MIFLTILICCYADILARITIKNMFDDIWKEAVLKATPIFLITMIFASISLLPAYVMTGMLINQQRLEVNR